VARLLLVEDNEANRDMLSRRLARRGHEVHVALDGESVLAQALSCQPELVLMDVGLPGIDGWEATRRLRAHPQTAALPVIALTAHACETDRLQAYAAGCDDFDTKPVELPRLLAKVEDALRRLDARRGQGED
jgi:CheY-like chemotaxis protein